MMALPVTLQLLQASVSLVPGVLTGLLYDLLRGLRSVFPSDAYVRLADAAICVLAGGALFLLGFVVGEGELRIFMVLLFFAGGGAYLYTFSIVLLPLFCHLSRAAALPARFLGKTAKKVYQNAKKCFQKSKLWYMIIHNTYKPKRGGKHPAAGSAEEGQGHEIQAGRYYYDRGDRGADGLRIGHPDQYEQTHQ